jgi:hypothetical protein
MFADFDAELEGVSTLIERLLRCLKHTNDIGGK